jgi:hypothetical protein
MANGGFMEIAEGVESLFHDNGSLGLSQGLGLGDVVKQLSTFAQFGYQEANAVCLPRLQQLYNIRVVLMRD